MTKSPAESNLISKLLLQSDFVFMENDRAEIMFMLLYEPIPRPFRTKDCTFYSTSFILQL